MPYRFPELDSTSQPKRVVILLGGINTGTQGGNYRPLDVPAPGYCFGPNAQGDGTWPDLHIPPALSDILQTYADDKRTPGFDRRLTDTLAAQGDVILPFSYEGAVLTGDGSDPLLQVRPSPKSDPRRRTARVPTPHGASASPGR